MTWKMVEDIQKLICSKHVFFFVNSEEKVPHYSFPRL